MHMLNKYLKIAKANPRKIGVAAIIVVLVIGVIISVIATNNDTSDKKTSQSSNQKPATKIAQKNTGLKVIESSISCNKVPTYPGATQTFNKCDGKVKVEDKSKKEIEYTLDGTASHLYKNGVQQDLMQINDLNTKKPDVTIDTVKDNDKLISNISYVE